MDEITAWLNLARAPGLHGRHLQSLLSQFSSADALVSATPPALRDAGVPARLIEWFQSGSCTAIESDLRWLEHDCHHFVAWGSSQYPPLLAELDDAPVGLFVRGNPDSLSMPQLAIVGTRNPTPHGVETAHGFAAHLARCGLTVTSGLALGIDTASHLGALSANRATVAVCGTGLDIDYPRGSKSLAEQIAATGAVVSEFGTGTPPVKSNFPRRNRVISGLALGTLVVEAAIRSGSLITARLAAEQGREVFAIPGAIHNPMARGCHQLIRQGAKLVETATDIFDELEPLVVRLMPQEGATATVCARTQVMPGGSVTSGRRMDKGYEILLDALGFEPAGVDLLVVRTGLRADEVASMLLILELEEHILPYPGGLYVRAHPRQ